MEGIQFAPIDHTRIKDDEPVLQDSGLKPMPRAERRKCWDARDAFFRVSDEALRLGEAAAQDLHFQKRYAEAEQGFKTVCPASWVDHFIKARMKKLQWERAVRNIEAAK